MKKSIYFIIQVYELLLGNFLYFLAKKYASYHTKIMHFKDWYFNHTTPSSYKHEINLYNWMYDPAHAQFCEGGVFGRMLIKGNDRVLDLCCGDGSYAYLFFSDISSQVDAIDYDEKAIAYAKKNYRKNNIHFFCENLLVYDMKADYYDVIIMRAGVAYFTKEQRSILFDKIMHSLKHDGRVYIGTPLEKEPNFSANQIQVITNSKDFEKEFNTRFDIIFKQQTIYQHRINLNYILKKLAK